MIKNCHEKPLDYVRKSSLPAFATSSRAFYAAKDIATDYGLDDREIKVIADHLSVCFNPED